eukprot:TRINITY_DN164385_c0_g1_i1.p1 TRINITY_DN164385_c0_g1~~TRINITY_DN164385_c0_g1_i1.p1  ORF type:complete len:161 (+),score=12.55 TRINITY_DN164385_c0_g1_i1:33-515(+)
MSRKKRREAYAKQIERIVEWQKSDPESFSRSYVKYTYLRDTFFLFLLIYLFHQLLINIFSILSKSLIVFAENNPIFTVIVLIGSGILLYFFRERSKYYYGLVEIGFGTALIYTAVDQISSLNTEAFPAIGAAMYIVVRGLDNLNQGYKAQVEKCINNEQK